MNLTPEQVRRAGGFAIIWEREREKRRLEGKPYEG